MQQTAIIFQITNLSTLKVHKRGTWLIWTVTYLQTNRHYTYYHFATLILSLRTIFYFLCKSYVVDVFITTITYDMTALNQFLVEQNPQWCQPTITVTGTSICTLSATCLTDTSGGHNGTPDGTLSSCHTTAAFNHGSHVEIQDWGELLPCDGLLHYEAQPSFIRVRFCIGPLS